jgi:hypothetical protein
VPGEPSGRPPGEPHIEAYAEPYAQPPVETYGEAQALPPADEPPFWMPVEEIPRQAAPWPSPRMRAGRSGSVHRSVLARDRTAAPREPRRTAPAMAALVLLSLCAAFFAWVSAEPLWLAVGHGDQGTATITRCTGSGIGQRCVGEFRTDGFTATVALLGVADGQQRVGAAVSARMVDRDSRQAYVGDDHLALHLRWTIGLTLVLLCGAGIAWASGANRLADKRARRRAVLGSLAGPLLLTLGFLAASY